MEDSAKIIFLIFLLGLLAKNNLVACAAGIILSLSVSSIVKISPENQKFFLNIGLIFLIMGVLVPFCSRDVSLKAFYKNIFTVEGIIACLVGALAAVLAGKGVYLLKVKPEVMIGLIFGNIIGASLFNGVPTGPLVAAGITAFFFYLLRAF